MAMLAAKFQLLAAELIILPAKLQPLAAEPPMLPAEFQSLAAERTAKATDRPSNRGGVASNR
ncbi:hypothetical protein [Lysinibacillus xylanilyticus]|uniref:Uncharacterized protein n=1 Tax=Lysinibacillus xylanilyticus TaxID=582475 RepID=A0ABV3VWU6_9BACI